MSDTMYAIKESTIVAIGDAIREKTGTTAKLNPETEMPEAILGIETGGGDFTIERIEITTPPDVTQYEALEVFNPTGMVVMEYYSDGTSAECLGYEYSSDELTLDDTEVVISYTWRGVTVTTTQAIEVLGELNIYGVEWDGTATTELSRTDKAVDFTNPVPYVAGATEYSSPFDNIYPWSGIKRVTDVNGGELVEIPRFWYKWTTNGDALKLQIADSPLDGFYTSPAHADRGDGYGERDVVYVGRYHSCADGTSTSGRVPKTAISIGDARNAAHNLGNEYWQLDNAMIWTIRMLYLVEYANWDSQAVIGFGTSGGSSAMAVGASDNIPYHTGTVEASRDTSCVGVQYRYIEGLWDNIYTWCDGISLYTSYVRATNTPSEYSNTTYPNVGSAVRTNGFIKSWSISEVEGFEYMLCPKTVVSTHGYISDQYNQTSSGSLVLVGGNYNQKGQNVTGLFHICKAYSNDPDRGYRLIKLPNPP